METDGTLPSALTRPVLSEGVCRAQRAPQPQAAFLSGRLSSLDQPWAKVGLHLPTQGPLSLSPSPQTLLWETVRAGDPSPSAPRSVSPCSGSAGLGNGCWIRSSAHTPSCGPGVLEGRAHECVRCPVGTGSQSQETCPVLLPSSPSLASRKARGTLTGGWSTSATWVRAHSRAARALPQTPQTWSVPAPCWATPTGMLGAVLGATGFLHRRGRSKREIWLWGGGMQWIPITSQPCPWGHPFLNSGLRLCIRG